jgi:choline dehydrogenase
MAIPRYADTVVIGGGTSGAVVAALLVERSDQSVLVLEAGPDFGPVGSGRWPRDLEDASALGTSCDGGYNSEATYKDRVVPFERARVIGGCSSHNGCAAIWGSRVDYDGWAAMGLPGWSADDLLPLFREANRRMRVKTWRADDITPFQQACLDAASAAGIPLSADLNDLDEDQGMAASPVNILDGTRWNTAFAWLDPVRDRQNLSVIGNAPVSRVLLDGARVVAVEGIGPDGPFRVACGRVVVSAGTYESPVVLLRSGIGDPDELREAGIDPQHVLPGVGRNLHDHPSVSLTHSGTPDLEARMLSFSATRWMPEEQTIAKVRSSLYPAGAAGFDLHMYPVGGPAPDGSAGWRWAFPIACMTPKSRGSVRLRSAEPDARPVIDHRYLQDADGHDKAVLLAGIERAREIIAASPLRELVGPEIAPGPMVTGAGALGAWADATCAHYYHPVGTCAMGPAADPMAVTDERGSVHGIDNLYVADCSIMPVIPRANTNIPAVVVGERIAGWLLDA